MTGRSSQARLAKPANVGATSRSNSAVSDMEGSRRSSVAVPTVMALTNGSCIVGVFGNSNEKVHIQGVGKMFHFSELYRKRKRSLIGIYSY